jgi:hypothetical protein
MVKPKKYTDLIFISILGLFIVISIYLHFIDGYVLPINFYPGLISWLIVVGIKIYNTRKEYFLVLIVLLFYSVNIINFTVVSFNINLLGVLLLVIYSLINKEMIMSVSEKVFKGSKEEQETERNKLIDFYFEKFKKCEVEELKEIFNNFNNCPLEAQIALKKVREEKK